jgi:hypothetical protein
MDRLKDRCVRTRRVRDRIGHDLASELIVTRRKADRELLVASSVALGWTPSTRAAAPGQPDIVGLKQSFCLQPVEVELRLVAGDSDGMRRLVAADWLILGADELIQPATYRVGQDADPRDVPVKAAHNTPPANGQIS